MARLMEEIQSSPEFWRQRAAEIRKLAGGIGVDETMAKMLADIAKGYERLAERAKEHLAHDSPGSASRS
jgi:hypothetical protein